MQNVAVLGGGAWGRNHVRNYLQLQESNLKYVSDINRDVLKELKVPEEVKLTPDYKEVLRDQEVSAISICTPASTHYKLAKEALESGKNVLVEKPISMASDEAQQLIDIAKERGLTLMVGHIFRFDESIRRAKEEYKKGTFGKIYYLSLTRMSFRSPRSDCGAVINYAVHDFDIMCDVLDMKYPEEITAVTMHSLGRKFEDLAILCARFKNSTLGYSQVSWLSPKKVRDFWIIGEKKSAFVDTKNIELTFYEFGFVPKYNSFGDFQLISREGEVYKPVIEKKEPLKSELSHFLACVKNHKEPIASGEVGLRTIKMVEAALRSAELKKTVQLDQNGQITG